MHRLISLRNRTEVDDDFKMTTMDDSERSEDHLVFEDLIAQVKLNCREERCQKLFNLNFGLKKQLYPLLAMQEKSSRF